MIKLQVICYTKADPTSPLSFEERFPTVGKNILTTDMARYLGLGLIVHEGFLIEDVIRFEVLQKVEEEESWKPLFYENR